MDLTTVLGLVVGVGMLFFAMLSDGNLQVFWDLKSLLFVVGGTLGATMVSVPMGQLRSVAGLLRVAFSSRMRTPDEVIPLLVHFAEKARREGLLAMEEEASQLDDPFLRKGLQLVVDGVDPELVREVLEIEIHFMEERHAVGRRIFQTAGTFAPAFGMLGTVVGLIRMLADLTNADAIGTGMALALITTFYGAILANVVFLPIANKLQAKSEQEVLMMQLMVQGVQSIQAGENPRIVEEKLEAFLSKSALAARRRREDSIAVGEAGTAHVR